MRDEPSPHTLFATAEQFLDAATAAADHPQNLWLPFYFLVGFSLELSFKCVMRLHGAEERTLMKTRHDLDSGYAQAIMLGFVPSHPRHLEFLIDYLQKGHAEHTFRYLPERFELCLPNKQSSLEKLRAHFSALREQYPSLDGQ